MEVTRSMLYVVMIHMSLQWWWAEHNEQHKLQSLMYLVRLLNANFNFLKISKIVPKYGLLCLLVLTQYWSLAQRNGEETLIRARVPY